jgi:hypothetical protein
MGRRCTDSYANVLIDSGIIGGDNIAMNRSG